MALTLGGYAWVKNLQKSPVLQQNMPQIDTHLKGGCFSCLGILASSISLAFSPDSSYFPPVNPNGPPQGVIGQKYVMIM